VLRVNQDRRPPVSLARIVREFGLGERGRHLCRESSSKALSKTRLLRQTRVRPRTTPHGAHAARLPDVAHAPTHG